MLVRVQFKIKARVINAFCLFRYKVELRQAWKNVNSVCFCCKKVLFLGITIAVEVEKREDVCRGSNQLYNNCEKSRVLCVEAQLWNNRRKKNGT